MANIPEKTKDKYCGVGNPLSYLSLKNLQNIKILDIGCGAGFDILVALNSLGDNCQAFGTDITKAMIDCATDLFNQQKLPAKAILVKDTTLPFADNSFDFVSSNGVFNLSLDKLSLYKDIHRILKPGGKLAFADIVSKTSSANQIVDAMAWSN
ncbi:MAG: class I SAM-dependent methyltransferase [Desulfotalea sp.]